MAQCELDRETFSCSICLDLLKDPVTVACGHSYCMSCLQNHWDEEEGKRLCSCPQCRQTFIPRPALVKNTMLAALVEQLKRIGPQASPAEHCYAGPEDVACDVCTERKLKAVKSCLVCVASYCEKHLQRHYNTPPLRKHKLVDPCKGLQEKLCPRHDEVMRMFCRTDRQCICYLCSLDQHKGHDMVSAAAERTERQTKLEVSRLNIRRTMQDHESDVKQLQQQTEDINRSTDKAMQDSQNMLAQRIRLMEERCSKVKHKLRAQQETEVRRVKELQEKLEQEIAELKRTDAELMKLSHTEDHIQFLLSYPTLPAEPTNSSSIQTRPLSYFEDVTAAVSELRDELDDVLKDKCMNISPRETEADQPEPETRAELLKYSRDITLDPNTAHRCLSLSEGNRKATVTKEEQPYPGHSDRFSDRWQVLSKEKLSGRCYWEVEWRGGGVCVAVAHKSISRAGTGKECLFGHNDKSWMLKCDCDGCSFWHNNAETQLSGPVCSRVGVYLDSCAGTLSFYSICKTMTLLHRVHTHFTPPLYAGFRLYLDSSPLPLGKTPAAEFCKLK